MSAEIIAFRKRDKPKVKPAAIPSRRLEALDILRGLCVIGMILVAYAGDWQHRFLVLNHADWHGLALADMIFPGFLFCAGVTIPLSFAGRAALQSRGQLALHILWRAAALIVLGIVLNFLSHPDIGNFRIPGILQRIGLCYGLAGAFCLAVGRKSDADFTLAIWPVLTAAVAMLAGYAALLLAWPGGAASFDSSHALPAVVDRAVFTTRYMWPYGLTDGVVTFDPEGLISTLGAIANVLLGVIASLYIRKNGLKSSLVGLAFLGFLLFVVGLGFDARVPIIKKIWTPTFAMVSGGFSLIAFVLLSLIADVFNQRAWAYPIKVFGANATLAFVAISLINIVMEWPVQLNPHALLAQALGGAIPEARVASLVYSVILLAAVGLILWPLYRKRWFLKI